MDSDKKIYGLNAKEVEERVRAGQSNAPVEANFKTPWQIIKTNTFTYFNGIFVVLAILLLSVRSIRDITFMPVIIINTLIGIVQEFRAKATLEKLSVLNAQKVLVMRGGKKETIATTDLVLDDIAIFRAGDQISADAEVISGSAFVNEALLTGEQDEIEKKEGAELMSGSFVISGECIARVTKVGEDAYAAKLTLQAKAIKTGEQSEIIRSLNKIVKIAGTIIIPVGAIMFAQQFFLKGASAQEAVQGMAAAVVGMIPEGLFLLASISLAISAVKMARQEVMVHEMKSVETLAHVDVFCVDKTGTITSPEMTVREVLPADFLGDVSNDVTRAFSIFAHSSKAANTTATALQNYFTKASGKATEFVEFSSKYKYSAAEIDGKKYVMGAPEFVLKDTYEKYARGIEKYSEKGYRVLVFGSYSGKLDGKELRAAVKPLAFAVLENPVRDSAPATFKYFAEQGVRVIVISGDNPVTVSEVARTAKIEGAENYIDARELVTDKDYEKAVRKYTVFGRVLPEQKRKIVQTLQAQKHVVAMTGDGVNDVLALKDADCSVAMASGADAAVQAAQLVLLDSDFSRMPGIVREGRRVVNNLERSGSLFIVKNVFSAGAALISIIGGFKYPLLPAQVSFVAMWVIGLPSFLLSQMPNEDLIHGSFINNILRRAVPGGMVNIVLILIMNMILHLAGIDADIISTACTAIFSTVGVMYLLHICLPLDLYRSLVLMLCIGGLTGCALVVPWMFHLNTEIPFYLVATSVGTGAISLPLFYALEKLNDKVTAKRDIYAKLK